MSLQQLPSANHIADFILAMAKLDYNMDIDQLQLNKLCYLVNGFTLKEQDTPAFYNDVESWRYGPVIPEVYATYKHYGEIPITHLDMCRTSLKDKNRVLQRYNELVQIIGEFVASIISGIIKEYGKYNGNQLVSITHGNDTPWKRVYKSGRNNIIHTSIIKDFYRRLQPDDAGR